ncbi:hypothetical protein [Burkholderia multivorans]|uniref:hypothetical protein n=1 Tax=Burkholderia multivorans TaxID=87883 RepID=UPI000F792A53|nr:hypothetical protein [Burkholderia multivorans]MDR8918497.1 hypothetical protein [Burkholderia multivorans]MDR8924221.1 hypothetical protein [Burkholderia multivorans]MDR8969171.1 hypothetical protein [Burkholderia multivorans]MDR8993125.1 hypothetical protein [Burkholderia multivorans]MDR9023828.1 hypothetical protein [Burkholderia multivorans]
MADVRVPAGTLKWLGDSLLCDGEPAIFQFMRRDGRIDTMPLRECLAVADRIDSYGLSRIVSALEYGLQHNMLDNEDCDAWATERTCVLSLSTAEWGE